MSKEYSIKLRGVDSWGRPVYKVQELNVYLGDVNNLWYGSDKTKEVIDNYYKDNLEQLCIFGAAHTDDIGDTFDEIDPLGTNLKKDIKLNII